jgi:hypothetical protein
MFKGSYNENKRGFISQQACEKDFLVRHIKKFNFEFNHLKKVTNIETMFLS